MNGAGHRALAAAAWLGAAPHLGVHDWRLALAGCLPAVAFSAGPTSPDMDNTRAFKRLDGAIDDESLGGCGPLQHRGILHSWMLPAAAVPVVYDPRVLQVLAVAALAGWTSHLIGDAIAGQAGYGTRRGVPLFLWFWHVGAGFKVGGWVERALTVGFVGAAVWLGVPPGAREFVVALAGG